MASEYGPVFSAVGGIEGKEHFDQGFELKVEVYAILKLSCAVFLQIVRTLM